MGFGQAVKACFGKYADFKGRASRSEYWYFALFVGLLFLAGFLIMGFGDIVLGGDTAGIVFGILAVVAGLGLLVPGLAVTVRRLHDTNSSGWWYLLALLPYVGGTIMFVWCCIRGTAGENRFGPDPLAPDLVEAFD